MSTTPGAELDHPALRGLTAASIGQRVITRLITTVALVVLGYLPVLPLVLGEGAFVWMLVAGIGPLAALALTVFALLRGQEVGGLLTGLTNVRVEDGAPAKLELFVKMLAQGLAGALTCGLANIALFLVKGPWNQNPFDKLAKVAVVDAKAVPLSAAAGSSGASATGVAAEGGTAGWPAAAASSSWESAGQWGTSGPDERTIIGGVRRAQAEAAGWDAAEVRAAASGQSGQSGTGGHGTAGQSLGDPWAAAPSQESDAGPWGAPAAAEPAVDPWAPITEVPRAGGSAASSPVAQPTQPSSVPSAPVAPPQPHSVPSAPVAPPQPPAQQPSAQPQQTPVFGETPRTAYVPEPTWAALVLDDGTRHEIGTALLLGRDPSQRPGLPHGELVRITDAEHSISKTHVAVGRAADGIWAVDCNSTNGVDWTDPSGSRRRLVPGERTLLASGGTLHVGGRTARVEGA